MVLAMLAAGIAVIIGVTCILTSRATVGGAFVLRDHLRARQIAESSLEATMHDVAAMPTWRDDRAEGEWVDGVSLYGGIATVTATFAPPPLGPGDVDDQSFETATGTLPTPLLSPPMTGVIGGWTVSRTALIQTGATVPTIGIQSSGNATDGSNAAFVSFGLSVTGTGTFSQQLPVSAQPNTVYELSVDVATNYAITNRTFELRVYAGTDIIASSEDATAYSLPTLPGDPPDVLGNPAALPEVDSVLTELGLSGTTSTYALRFITTNSPPAGLLTIEFSAGSTGVADQIEFDNVRLTARSNDPLTLTAVAAYGDASHMVTASVVESLTGGVVVREWSEP